MSPPRAPKKPAGRAKIKAPKVIEADEILDAPSADDPTDDRSSDDEDRVIETDTVDNEDDTEAYSAGQESEVAVVDAPDPEPSALSVSDPLRRYLEEVRRYPLLSPEEEFRLAMKLKETGDIQAAKTLVSANLRLVVKIAYEYRSIYSNVLDLIQEGNVGLMKAVSKYDPSKGARLGYYSSWWIRSYILKYLLDNFRLVKIGTTQAQKKLFYHLMREKERLEAQGLLAGPKLLAEKLNVREKDVVEMEHRLSGRGAEMSLDTPLGRGDEGESRESHASLVADDRELAEESLVRDQLLKLLEGSLPEFKKLLDTKELKILQERLLAEEPKTLQEVADAYGLTRERARQIEAKVIQKLRAHLAPAFEGSPRDPKDNSGPPQPGKPFTRKSGSANSKRK